jgi:hypothetical protein
MRSVNNVDKKVRRLLLLYCPTRLSKRNLCRAKSSAESRRVGDRGRIGGEQRRRNNNIGVDDDIFDSDNDAIGIGWSHADRREEGIIVGQRVDRCDQVGFFITLKSIVCVAFIYFELIFLFDEHAQTSIVSEDSSSFESNRTVICYEHKIVLSCSQSSASSSSFD